MFQEFVSNCFILPKKTWPYITECRKERDQNHIFIVTANYFPIRTI